VSLLDLPPRTPGPVVPPLAAWAGRRRGTAPRGSHRARALCAELGDPHLGLPAVHVVGTNGKTSVVRLASALLASLGVRAGDTTSPHLQDVVERVRLDDRPVPPERLTEVLRRLPNAVRRAEDRLGEAVAFFDVMTAVALRTLADAEVEVAVVEAGIGGTGDATALLRAPVTVLTPIGLDHPQLGATHAAVAAEKAGVVAPGATVLSAAQPPGAAATVARIAARRGARLLRAGRDFGVLARRPTAEGQLVELQAPDGLRVRTRLPLRGAHQADNAALALAAVQAALPGRRLDRAALVAGFAGVRIPGRVEVLHLGGTTIVLDGAHDAEATGALAAAVEELAPGSRAVAVVGVTGGRDPVALLAPLRARIAGVVATSTGQPGAVPAADVAARLQAAFVSRVTVSPSPAAATDRALGLAGPEGLLLVTGSLPLVGEIRRHLGGLPG
jgi:dihydrofolate synthase / folylpolyglutamate synthase